MLSIGGSRVSRDNWNSLLARYKPGDRVTIQVQRFRRTVELVLELREPGLLILIGSKKFQRSSDSAKTFAKFLADGSISPCYKVEKFRRRAKEHHG